MAKAPMSKNIMISLAIMIPIFLICLSPSIWWWCIPAENRYDPKYNALQDAMWIVPLVIVGFGFIGGICWMFYNKWRDSH